MKDKIELKKYYSTKEFLENYIYEGNNLGVECTEEGQGMEEMRTSRFR